MKKQKHSKLHGKAFAAVAVQAPVTKKLVELNVKRDLTIGSDLNRELREQPALYAWYAQLKVEAEEVYRNARYQEHCVEEDLYVRARRKENGKKASETEIKMHVKRHRRMRLAYEARMKAESDLETLKAMLVALEQRSRMLQSLAGNIRQERSIRDYVKSESD